MTRKFKIAAKSAKDIGSLYNTIMSCEIVMKGLLTRGPWDADAYDRSAARANDAARTLLVEYGIVAIGYFKHEDLADYRRGALTL